MKTIVAALVATMLSFAANAPARAVTVVQAPDTTVQLIGTEVLLQAGLDRQTPQQSGLAALVAECILQTPVTSNGSTMPFVQAVRGGGGDVSYAVEPRDVRFYLEGMTRTYPALLSLFRTTLAKPDFSAATLRAARSALNAKIAENGRLPLNVGINMLNRSFYQDSDAGMPPFGMPATVAGFTTQDVRSFFTAHYRQGDAVISVAGDVAMLPGNSFAQLLDELPQGTSRPVALHQPPLPSTSHELIARRDVPVPWLVAQYPAPDVRSKDFGAMLVLTAFVERTLADVSSMPSISTRSSAESGVGALYNFDTRPANVVIYVDGGLGDPTRTFATALTVVNVLGHAKLGGDLSDMKAAAEGRFLEDAATLEDRAWLAGTFAAAHLPPDYVAQTLKAIDSTTAADLQRVASHYLGSPTIALVLPR